MPWNQGVPALLLTLWCDSSKKVTLGEVGKQIRKTHQRHTLMYTPRCASFRWLLKKLKGISSGNLIYCALRCFPGAQRGTFACRNWNLLFEEQGGSWKPSRPQLFKGHLRNKPRASMDQNREVLILFCGSTIWTPFGRSGRG